MVGTERGRKSNTICTFSKTFFALPIMELEQLAIEKHNTIFCKHALTSDSLAEGTQLGITLNL